MAYQQLFDETCKRRDDFWQRIGNMDEHVIASAANPSFMGGPRLALSATGL